MASLENQKASLQRLSSNRWQRPGYPANRNGSRTTKPRKADEAYGKLKELILTSDLAPGEMLDERHLMELLETGRTPLREAIQRLAHEGLVSIAPRKGSWVTDLSISDLQELISAREVVEPAVAASAAGRVTPEDIGTLRGLIDDVTETYRAGDLLASIQSDRAFHTRLALMSDNTYLARIVDDINTATLRYWHLSFKHAGDLTQTYDHHHRIIEQLERRDPEGVRQALLDHIDIFRSRMQQVLGSGM
ncbi:MAG: GntR family transcriptional regulator [Thermomicrobiales bacterium]